MRSPRFLLKKALKLSYLVNVALSSSFLLPSCGVKPTKGKMQLFVATPNTHTSLNFPPIPCFNINSSTLKKNSTYMLMTLICDISINSTVWRKQRSGLQYWGASWSPKGTQGTRVRCPHSQFERGDYSLQINDVTEEDGGVYSCSVELGNRVVENIVNLRIIKGKKLIHSFQTLDEGLQCILALQPLNNVLNQ